MPGFISPQLASEAPEPPAGEQWVHELKLDGYRIQAHIDKAGKVRLYTRSGLDWTHRMAPVAREFGRLSVESAILDGEVVVLDQHGQSSFADLQAAFEEGAKHPLTYFAFDLLHLNGHNLRQEPLVERKKILAQMLGSLGEQETVRYGQHLETEGDPIFKEACKMGAEGIISKRADSVYTSGRTKSWIKIKCVRLQEFVVGGFTKPNNGTEGIGALLLGYYDQKKLIYAGRTGTGFTQVSSRHLRKQLEAMRQTRMPFEDVPGVGRQGCSLGAARVGGPGSIQYLDGRQSGAASQLQRFAGRQEGDGGAPRDAGSESFAEDRASRSIRAPPPRRYPLPRGLASR